MITLNEDQVQKLSNLILDIPTRYGTVIINLINSFVAENNSANPELKKQDETIS